MTKEKKQKKLRYLEYYDLQECFDDMYAKSRQGEVFTNLMELISSEENIRLAYRNIKRNSGSHTSGTDKLNIKDIEKLSAEKLVEIIQRKLKFYKPKAVRRVEIPKPNGKTRPLGIPTIVDRLVQQCILQVLEPICEAKFHKRSNGFRPNRSTEHAIAQCDRLIQLTHLHYVVDVDIKGFFDNVNHSKSGSLDIGCGERSPEESLNIAEENQQLRKQIKALEKENKRLSEMNEFLEDAAAFFAASRQKSGKNKD